MRKVSLVVLVLLVTGAFIVPVRAQDDMGDKIVCDSTLITLLYIAEADYGFHPMLDVSQYEKGQFQPLFDEMMAMMDDGDMMEEEGDMMEDEDMMEEEGDMMEEDDMMMTHLEPGVVEGEDEACTALREEVEGFLYAALSGEDMMME